MNNKIQIHNQQTLLAEKQRLNQLCKEQEELLSLKLNYVKNNYDELIVNSIMPFDNERNEKISGILDFVNNNVLSNVIEAITGAKKDFSSKALKVAETLIIGMGYNFIQKIFSKKAEENNQDINS